jgi:hypothetical protein
MEIEWHITEYFNALHQMVELQPAYHSNQALIPELEPYDEAAIDALFAAWLAATVSCPSCDGLCFHAVGGGV